MSSSRKAAISFIFVTVTLDMLAFGIIAPVLPRLILSFQHSDVARTSETMGWFVSTWALMQFFFAPVLGILSDRFGRRPVILLSNFGLGLDYIIMALAPTLPWLFVGRVLSGLTASSMPTANAYLSDVLPPERRAKAFGIFGAAFGIGFVLGPALGGWLGAISPRLPFWIAACFSLVNATYGFFVLPESLPKERRAQSFKWSKANPVGSLRLLRSHHELFGLATVNFLAYLAHEVYATVFVLYCTARYGWTQGQLGASLALVGVATMIVSAGIVGWAVRRFGEWTSLFLGMGLAAAGFLIFGLAPVGWIFMVGILVNAFWSLASAPSQSIMTRRVSPGEQGELQGALGSMRGIAMILGPGMFSLTFAFFMRPGHVLPGAPWYLAALLLLAAVVIAARVSPSNAQPLPQPVELQPAEAE
jgi:DHA1 family tetracycline resistance protein-like MFS transporter